MLAACFGAAIAFGSVHASAAPATTHSVATRANVVVEATLGQVDLEVEGWAKPRVELEADVGKGSVARLEVDGDRVRVVIDGPGVPGRGRVRLRVPKGAELQVATIGGDVSGEHLAGRTAVSTISGDVRIAGSATRVDVATTSGDIEVAGAKGRVDLATVDGTVRARDVGGELRVESISGEVEVDHATLDRLRVSTVSARVVVDATLRSGPHRLETSSGDVRLAVPRDAALRIAVSTFTGEIVDELGGARGTHDRKHRRELGKGGGPLEIATLSGDVTLAARSR
jgi:DUF4097 and DUF4098 domain-containing protein YvlB